MRTSLDATKDPHQEILTACPETAKQTCKLELTCLQTETDL